MIKSITIDHSSKRLDLVKSCYGSAFCDLRRVVVGHGLRYRDRGRVCRS